MPASTHTESLPPLRLIKGADRRLRNGHLWVYSNEIDIQATPLRDFAPGQLVQVENNHGKASGTAYVNPHSLICARLLSRGLEPWNRTQLEARITSALQLRERCFEKPFYRLVYGESDLLPGLVVDRYGDHLVVQLNTAGMDSMRDEVTAALRACLQPASILLRNDSNSRVLEGLPTEVAVAYGTPPATVELEENGVRFQTPLATGQKTGWFYDQRANRAWLRQVAPGQRVLDVFSYVGSFGVQAGVFGAAAVTCLDSSAPALETARANAALNGIESRLTTLQGDASESLRQLRDAGERFGVVILDPPAYIKRKKDAPKGIAAYRRLNTLAMQLVEPGGFLLTCSCSMHMPREELLEAVRHAAVRLQRHARIISEGMQGPDHPVHPAIPETRYLKALLAQVN